MKSVTVSSSNHRMIAVSVFSAIFGLVTPAFSQTLSDNNSYRLNQQETEITNLTGRVEELTFQLKQVNQRLDRLTKDSDFRLKELEKSSVSVSQSKNSSPVPVNNTAAPEEEAPVSTGSQNLYEESLKAYQSKKYGEAEAGFQKFLETSGKDALTSNAYYWLGETYYSQKKYKDAAGSFLEGYRKMPNGNKGDHNLYRLGSTLFLLNKKDEGCATLNEASRRIGQSTDSQKDNILKKIQEIRTTNKCS